MMSRQPILWAIAFLITAVSAVFQRVTGPTYPLRGTAVLGGKEIPYTLERSHAGYSNHSVRILTGDEAAGGVLLWRLHDSESPWNSVLMSSAGGVLSGELPAQPPAGKLDYRIILEQGGQRLELPEGDPAVIRFKGEVPTGVLILHIAAMFGGMLFSARAGIECFLRVPRLRLLTILAVVFLGTGGIVLGPVVQHYAFDAYWTGWPFGPDLTDNKTAVALLAWVVAALALRTSRSPRAWVLAASVITLVVFLIPHSVLGSERPQQRAQRITVSFRCAENPSPLSS